MDQQLIEYQWRQLLRTRLMNIYNSRNCGNWMIRIYYLPKSALFSIKSTSILISKEKIEYILNLCKEIIIFISPEKMIQQNFIRKLKIVIFFCIFYLRGWVSKISVEHCKSVCVIEISSVCRLEGSDQSVKVVETLTNSRCLKKSIVNL